MGHRGHGVPVQETIASQDPRESKTHRRENKDNDAWNPKGGKQIPSAYQTIATSWKRRASEAKTNLAAKKLTDVEKQKRVTSNDNCRVGHSHFINRRPYVIGMTVIPCMNVAILRMMTERMAMHMDRIMDAATMTMMMMVVAMIGDGKVGVFKCSSVELRRAPHYKST